MPLLHSYYTAQGFERKKTCGPFLLGRVLKESSCGTCFYLAGFWKKAAVALFLLLVRVLKESSCCTFFATGQGFKKCCCSTFILLRRVLKEKKTFNPLLLGRVLKESSCGTCFYWAGFWKKAGVALFVTGQGFEKKLLLHFFFNEQCLKKNCCTFLLNKVLKVSN